MSERNMKEKGNIRQTVREWHTWCATSFPRPFPSLIAFDILSDGCNCQNMCLTAYGAQIISKINFTLGINEVKWVKILPKPKKNGNIF